MSDRLLPTVLRRRLGKQFISCSNPSNRGLRRPKTFSTQSPLWAFLYISLPDPPPPAETTDCISPLFLFLFLSFHPVSMYRSIYVTFSVSFSFFCIFDSSTLSLSFCSIFFSASYILSLYFYVFLQSLTLSPFFFPLHSLFLSLSFVLKLSPTHLLFRYTLHLCLSHSNKLTRSLSLPHFLVHTQYYNARLRDSSLSRIEV
jgi:hypothetical protein